MIPLRPAGASIIKRSGEVAERLKAAVSKTVVGVTPPGVQIPPSPPLHTIKREFD
jgi:hypothetical protein